MNIERILIVGDGTAGPSLATALHRQGFVPKLVGRSEHWPLIGADINLAANGVPTLRALGVGAGIEQVHAIIEQWSFFDQQGERLCDVCAS